MNVFSRGEHQRVVLGLVLLLTIWLTFACKGKTAQKAVIEEASGVGYHNGDLFVVDDSLNGAFFKVPLKGKKFESVIPLNDFDPVTIALPEVGIWVDLEGIDFLADGRVILLSERLHSLVGEEGIIAEYDYPLGEIGRRGLEGVAVRELPDGSSRIAAVWEGGYPRSSFAASAARKDISEDPFPPLIFVHDLKRGTRAGRIRMKLGVATAELDVPKPAGVEPDAQRFRAPDLVWYRWPQQQDKWGFIVLLSSQNAAAKPEFLYHWLQRFDMEGKPFGSPIDITKYVPARLGGENWEGLGWFVPGKSLVLVHESSEKVPPNAFILELPSDWQTTL